MTKMMNKKLVLLAVLSAPAFVFAANDNSNYTAQTISAKADSNVVAADTTAKTTAKNTDDKKITQEFDGLGGNGVLLEKARALNPEVHTTIVQNRIVDRTNRFELAGEYANTFGGDTYIRTGTFGIQGNYHITNRWSVGAKYGYSFNKLTNEGDDLIDRAAADAAANPGNPKYPVPDIDYPKSMAMALVNYYPLYGKISWLGKSISHFDVYGQLGYGSIGLDSGATSAISGGIGVGVWGNENITTRLELTYVDYTAQYWDGPMKMGITSAAVQVGWLF